MDFGKLYDGRLHRIPFTVGDDFIAKMNALRDDGFTYQIHADHFLACKVMPGDPIPREIA